MYILQSSSAIVTVAWLASVIKMPPGNDDASIVRMKLSSPSKMLSFVIGMFKYVTVVLAGNVIQYGPES